MKQLIQKIQDYAASREGDLAVAFKNLKTGEAFGIHENANFRSASTIKLAVMTELLRQAQAGKIDLQQSLVLEESMKAGGDGILKELNPGHSFTWQELMLLMIILSDNMATNILIDKLGMDNVNDAIDSLGLPTARLRRKMMDSQAVREGRENSMSAWDALVILEKIYLGQNVSQEASARMMDALKRQQVRGRLDLYLPEEQLIAHKTGDLDNLEHDVGIFFLPQGDYILCVLTDHAASNKEARESIGCISKIVYDYMTKTA